MELHFGLAYFLAAVFVVAGTPIHSPSGITECDTCLLGIHANITRLSCSDSADIERCLSGCRPSLRPEVSLAVLADLYDKLRNLSCDIAGCPSSITYCLDAVVIRQGGLLSTSLRCGYPEALGQGQQCLGYAISSPYSCGLNPGGIVNYITTNGYNFLCDTTKRCYATGNVFEPGSGRLYTQYAIGDAARRYVRSCPVGTTFKTNLCTCFFDL